MSEKVVLTAELEVEDAKILVALLRMAAWREFSKGSPTAKPSYLVYLVCLRNERLLKDLTFHLQQAITKQIRTSREV